MASKFHIKQHSVLPGFGLTMGYTLLYLNLLVLIPLLALFLRTTSLNWSEFLATVTSRQVLAAYKLTFGAALIGAVVNSIFGFIVAWCLVRYRFPGRKLIDAMVDLPFALPTAVSGIALTTIYNNKGILGTWLYRLGIESAYSQVGVCLAMTFIGLPFVVRTLQPALEELDGETEEAAASLGANRWQTFRRVILPSILPALITGFSLAFARALGEYGAVAFISGNIPFETEVASLVIISKIEVYDIPGATAIGLVMLLISFLLLLLINAIQWWTSYGYKRIG